MKRRLSLFMALCLLLISCLALLPASAEDDSWKTISYVPLPAAESETPAAVALTAGQSTTLPTSCTIEFDDTLSVVVMNGKEIASGTEVKYAGVYEFKVYQKATYQEGSADNQLVTYEASVPHALQFLSGETAQPYGTTNNGFTFFPTVVCKNAYQLELKRIGSTMPIKTFKADASTASTFEGYAIDTFGDYILTVSGQDKSTVRAFVMAEIHFTVTPCYVYEIVPSDETDGKYNMGIEVGAFGDRNYSVMLDGATMLTAGRHQLSKVGAHVLELYSNGVKVEEGDSALGAMPTAQESTLYVKLPELSRDDLKLPEADENGEEAAFDYSKLELKAPIYLNLDLWDASFTLNGKPVSGMVEVNANGVNKLEVVDENGMPMGGLIRVTVEGEEPALVNSLDLTYRNPHYIYVIIVGVPAALLLIAAVVFLIKRRRIV